MYTEVNTSFYKVKWVYSLYKETNAFALYLASDVYCTCTCMFCVDALTWPVEQLDVPFID